jgi:hypothetical protein
MMDGMSLPHHFGAAGREQVSARVIKKAKGNLRVIP